MDELAPAAREEQNDTRPRRRARWPYWVCLLFFLYVLGMGPAEKFANAYPAVRPAFQIVYFPMVMLYHACPPIRPALNWYLRFWR